jgi:transcriptional regulator with XRE-family HTH domain
VAPVGREHQESAFGTLLRGFREAAALSQASLAERADLTAQAISLLERGRRIPHLETVGRLAEALGLTALDRARLLAVARGGPDPGAAAEPARSTPPAIDWLEQQRAPQRVTRPVRVGVLPPEADCYQPRIVSGELSAITSRGGTAVLCQVLSGLGGVGKTQLAAAHARQLWQAGDLDLLVWVPASSRSAIVAGYAQAHTAATGLEVQDAEQAASLLLAWLRSTDRSWLVVLDDLTVPGDLRGLWPPNVTGGRTIVTTRRRDAALSGAGRTLVDVDLFTPAEADAYLAARLSGPLATLLPGASALARDLGYLPLALAQATAYLIDRDLTCTEYAVRLADRRRHLRESLPEPSALPDDYQATVAATWSLSIELADNLAPVGLARPALELASLLDPAGITEDLFITPAAIAWMKDRGARQSVDAASARDALRCLHRLSLVTLDEASSARAVRVHALVQRATSDNMLTDRLGGAVCAVAEALIQAWPDVERDRDLGEALRACAARLANHSDPLWSLEDGGHAVLFQVGKSLGEVGQPAAAAAYFEQLRSEAAARLGPDYPDTLSARHNLAHWRGDAGDAAGAVAAYEELLIDSVRVHGPDHPDTLNVRHYLAYWRGKAGDAAGAAAAFEELLTDLVRVHGTDHPDILDTRHNLAYWRGEAGDAAGAAAAFEELLTDRLRVVGPDHPHTLRARSNLARWRGEAGDAAGAAAAYEELLTDRLRVFGHDHPDTLITRGNLASWRGKAGDAAGAAAAFEELLTDRLRVLGPDHPDTLTSRSNLARWRGEAGDAASAAAAFEDLLTDRLRVLGPDHPRTLSAKHNLAHYRGEAGDAAGAVAAFEELLTDRLRVHGPDHPDTLRARNNLARWRRETGDAASAATALEELLTDRLRVLGPDHPDTLTTRSNLARWRGEARDAAGAAAAFEELLTDSVRVLGSDHPDTLAVRNNLARWRGEAGDAVGAATAFEELLTDSVRVLGSDHPDTLAARNNLARWRRKAELPQASTSDNPLT